MTDYPHSLKDIEEQFKTETDCANYLASVRWPGGPVCPECQHDKFWSYKDGKILECAACGHKIRVMAGTIFQDTHLPLLIWFKIIWFLMSQKFGANAQGLMRVLNLTYSTVWNVLHKLRRAMVRETREKLQGVVEVDEAFIGGQEAKHQGRGAIKKTMVVVAVELPDGKRIGRIRLQVIENAKGDTLLGFIHDNVVQGSEVITDGFKGYSRVGLEGFKHTVKTMKKDKEALPHVHLVISLLKRWLLGTYQGGVAKRYTDYYLDEYVFRFNRRTSKHRGLLFKRMIEQAVATDPTTREDLVIRRPLPWRIQQELDFLDAEYQRKKQE